MYIVEMWEEYRDESTGNFAGAFHNLVMLQGDRRLVIIPFDEAGEALARKIPSLHDILGMGRMLHTTVHRYQNPFSELFRFHVLLTGRQPVNNLMNLMSTHMGEADGTALFEMHIVDALVPSGCPDRVRREYLVPFAEWRVQHARYRMQPYTLLGVQPERQQSVFR